MFKASQIISPSELSRKLPSVLRFLAQHPQALLLTPRNGEKFVLVNATIFEELLDQRFENQTAAGPSFHEFSAV